MLKIIEEKRKQNSLCMLRRREEKGFQAKDMVWNLAIKGKQGTSGTKFNE